MRILKKENMKKYLGFTLFELLVVISIIGVITAIGMISYSSAQKRARNAKRKEDIQMVQKALEQYYTVNNAYVVGCDPGTDFLPGGLPTDPKTGSYSDFNCDLDSYCVCATLESVGTGATSVGNASEVGTADGCVFGDGDYYCLQNIQ